MYLQENKFVDVVQDVLFARLNRRQSQLFLDLREFSSNHLFFTSVLQVKKIVQRKLLRFFFVFVQKQGRLECWNGRSDLSLLWNCQVSTIGLRCVLHNQRISFLETVKLPRPWNWNSSFSRISLVRSLASNDNLCSLAFCVRAILRYLAWSFMVGG